MFDVKMMTWHDHLTGLTFQQAHYSQLFISSDILKHQIRRKKQQLRSECFIFDKSMLLSMLKNVALLHIFVESVRQFSQDTLMKVRKNSIY